MDLQSGNSTVAELAVVPEASAAAEAAVAVAVAVGAIVVVVDASTYAVVAVVNTVAEPTAVVEDTAAEGTAPSSSAAGKDTAAARAVLPHGTLLMGAGQRPSDLVPLKPLDQQKQLWGPVGPYLYGLADELRNSLVLVVECSFCSVSG